MSGLIVPRCDCRNTELRCHQGAHCATASVGHVGLLRFCFACVGALVDMAASDGRLRTAFFIDLHDDGHPVGQAQWIPDPSEAEEGVRT